MKKSLLISLIMMLTVVAVSQNNCLDFDASDDYAGRTTPVTTVTDNFTITAWIKADAIPTDSWRCIAYNGIDGHGYGIGLYNGYLGGLYGGITFHYTSTILETGIWYHIAMRRSSGTTQFFLNGSLLNYTSLSTPLSPTNRFTIANMYSANNSTLYNTSFDGQIDEVSVWTTALNEEDIRALMYEELAGTETNLVAYYSFNETSSTSLPDLTSNNYDCNLTNMSDDDWVTSSAFFGPKNCLDFDGLNDWVSTSVSMPPVYTKEAWVYIESANSLSNNIVSGGDSDGQHAFWIPQGYSYKLSAGHNGTWNAVQDPNAFPFGSWQHIAVTYSSGTMTLYRNGIQVDQATGVAAFTGGTAVRIGSFNDQSNLLGGKLDDVRIWNDVRTEDEIRENMCKSLTGNEDNLLAYYNFDNSSGTVLQDFTGNGNDGTLNNMDNSDWVASRTYNTWLNTSSTDWYETTNWSLGEYPQDSEDFDLMHSVGFYNYSGGAIPFWEEDMYAYNVVIGENATLTNDDYSMYVYGNIIVRNDFNMDEAYIELMSENGTLIEDGGVLYCEYNGGFNEILTDVDHDISAGTTQNVGGLGVTITPVADLLDVHVECDYGDITKPFPIGRKYYLTHTSTDPINATVAFGYHDSELQGQSESEIQLYKSTDGDNWSVVSGAVHDDVNNTFTISGSNDLNGTHWTMSDGYSFIGNALDFERDDSEYVNCGSFNLTGTELTLECWFNAESFQSSHPYISSIIGTEDGSNAAMLRLGDSDIDNNDIQFVLYFSHLATQVKLTYEAAFSANTWYHVAGVYKSGEGMKIYVNGVEVASNSQSGAFVSNASFNIANNNSRYFDGKMDEIRIWSDARSQTEIRQNMCQVLTGSEDNLYAYYNCNSKSGTSLTDGSGNGRNALLVNNPSWVSSDAFANFLGDDTDWANAINWTTTSAPGAGDNVGFTSLNTYYSYASVGNSASVNNIVICDGKSMNINAGHDLTVANLYAFDDGYLRIYSTSMAADGTGSLIITGESEGNIQARRYLDVQTDYNDKWHYVSSGVDGQLIDNDWMSSYGIKSTPTYQFFRYDEPTNYWIIYGSTGNPVAFNDTEFVEARGYCLSKEWSGNVTFRGTARTSDVTYSADYNTDGGYGNNLVGNPYPCFLNATTTADANNNFLTVNAGLIDDNYEAIYIWDEQDGYDGTNQDYKVICNSPVSGYTEIDQDYIAPGQAFMVKVNSAGNIQFNESMQTHNSGAYYKGGDDLWPSVELKIRYNDIVNYTIVGFNESMTKGLDPSYDVGKMKGNPELALYTELLQDNGTDFAIQVLPYFTEDFIIPVGVDIANTGEYMFEVAKMDQIPNDIYVFFKDKKNGAIVNLKETNSYNCNLDEVGSINDRFELIFTRNAISIDELESSSSQLYFWVNEKTLKIYNPEFQTGIIEIFNLLGQPVIKTELNGSVYQKLKLDINPDYYIVSIKSENSIENKKIYVK